MKSLIILCILSFALFVVLMVISLINFVQKKKMLASGSDMELAAAEAVQYQELVRANEILEGLKDNLIKNQKEIGDILGNADDVSLKEYSGHVYLDAVLSTKEELCREKNIRFDLNVARLRAGFAMEDMDVVRLVQNILDNAVEAAEKTEKPYISFVVENVRCEGRNVIHMVAVNSKLKSVKPLGRQLATTKADKENHGFGTGIIGDIVEMYSGTVNFSDLGDRFKVDVVLPYSDGNDKVTDI